MSWYREAIGSGSEERRQVCRTRLETYNADDVHAQVAIRDWLTLLATAYDPAKRLPSVESLDGRFRRKRSATKLAHALS